MIMNWSMANVIRACGIAFLIALQGCTSVKNQEHVWVTDVELAHCKSMATASFTNRFPQFEIDKTRDIVVEIRDWREPTITIYLPFSSFVSEECFAFFYI